MGARPLRVDAWVVSRLRYGESWVALPLWILAILLLAVPKLGTLLVVPALIAFFTVVALGGTRTEKREIEVTREGVRVGRSFVPRTSIRRGRRSSPQRYTIDDAWRRVREIVVLEASAEEMDRLLRVDTPVRVTGFTTGAFPLHDYRMLLASVAIAALSSALMGEIPGVLAWGIALPLLLVYLIPGRADVGPDGLELRWLFVRRFVAARRIRRVDVEGDVVLIEQKDGCALAVPTLVNRRAARELAAHARALASTRVA